MLFSVSRRPVVHSQNKDKIQGCPPANGLKYFPDGKQLSCFYQSGNTWCIRHHTLRWCYSHSHAWSCTHIILLFVWQLWGKEGFMECAPSVWAMSMNTAWGSTSGFLTSPPWMRPATSSGTAESESLQPPWGPMVGRQCEGREQVYSAARDTGTFGWHLGKQRPKQPGMFRKPTRKPWQILAAVLFPTWASFGLSSWGSLLGGSPATTDLSHFPLFMVLTHVYYWALFEGKLVLRTDSGVLLVFFLLFSFQRSTTVHQPHVCEIALPYQEVWFFLIVDSWSKCSQKISPHFSHSPGWASLFHRTF